MQQPIRNQYLKANIISEYDIFANFNLLRSFGIYHKLAIMRIASAQTSVCIIPFPIKLMLDAGANVYERIHNLASFHKLCGKNINKQS
jgi:hypothetical protein